MTALLSPTCLFIETPLVVMLRYTLRTLAVTAKDIEQKLLSSSQLQPVLHVAVTDASYGCGTFFNIDIASPVFACKTLIQQHRLVNEVLVTEIKALHGFTLNTRVK